MGDIDAGSEVESDRDDSVSLVFDGIPRVDVELVALVIAVDLGGIGLIAMIGRGDFPWLLAPDGAIGEFPSNLVPIDVIAPLVLLSLFLFIVVVFGRLRSEHVGLELATFPAGLGAMVSVWLIAQPASLLLAGGNPLAPGPVAPAGGPAVAIGGFVAGLVGTALYEETLFRGFLLVQLSLLLEPRIEERFRRIAVALVVSSAYFALTHGPVAVAGTASEGLLTTFVGVFMLGLGFGAIYLRTRNLFVAIGVHALWNDPTALFVSPATARPAVAIAAVVVGLVWPWIERKFESV